MDTMPEVSQGVELGSSMKKKVGNTDILIQNSREKFVRDEGFEHRPGQRFGAPRFEFRARFEFLS